MTITQYGSTLRFQGNTSLAALAGEKLAIYDDNFGLLYIYSGVSAIQIASPGFQTTDIQVLSDGGFLLTRQTYPGQTYGGASYEVLGADGSVRVGTTDVASGTGHALGGPSAVATLDGGFVVAYTDVQDGDASSVVTYPPYGDFRYTSYDAHQGEDVGYRYFTPTLSEAAPPTTSYAPGDFEIANTGSFSNSGASGSDRASSQILGDTVALAGGAVVVAYLDTRNFGIPEERGGNVYLQQFVTLRSLTSSGASAPITVNTEAPTENTFAPSHNAVTGRGGEQLVSLGTSGFAVIWHENDYVADSSVYGGYAFNGTNTEIRYFDQSGTALTGEVQLFHRDAALGNLSPSVGASALSDGRIALVYQDGVYGVNGTSAGQLHVAVIGQIGTSIEDTAITPALSQGTSYADWSVQGLGLARFAVAYVGTAEGSVVRTFDAGVQPPCYCTGTRLLTDSGGVAVENLAIGDRIVATSGALRRVKWIGHRRLDLTNVPNPRAVWPVRVSAGAFGEGQPARDLWMSPGHSVFVEGVLMPIRVLANDATILQVPVDEVTYWHIELDSHDVILAEGLPAESYLDTGNRNAFDNGGGFVELHPDFEPKHWAYTCAPIRKDGPEVKAARMALLARAAAMGHATTTDPDLHVVADGRRIEPIILDGRRFAFALPADCRRLDLVSRVFVPRHVDAASTDGRELGLSVKRLQIDGAEVDLATLPIDDWHGLENRPRHRQRWTRGTVRLPTGSRLVLLDLAGEGRYRVERGDNEIALRA